MRPSRARSAAVALLAVLLAGGCVAGIAAAYGFARFARAWGHPHVGWLALAVAGQLLAIPAYAVAYGPLARMDRGMRLRAPLLLRITLAGFGAFVVGGGFHLDKRANRALECSEREADMRVLGMGALEWALLAPASWATAVLLLVEGNRRVLPSVLWPWALAVPLGSALALWLAVPERCERLFGGEGRMRSRVRLVLSGVGILRRLIAEPGRFWPAWLGIAAYWGLEIASLFGAARFIGLRLTGGETILAYATGYALTRRSIPLGGAAVTEAFLTFALHWAGQPVPQALAAVVVYRVLNLVLPALPALVAHARLEPVLEAADAGRPAGAAELRTAEAPLLRPTRR